MTFEQAGKKKKAKKGPKGSAVAAGGGSQVGALEMPGMCHPSTLRKSTKAISVLQYNINRRAHPWLERVDGSQLSIPWPAKMTGEGDSTITPCRSATLPCSLTCID